MVREQHTMMKYNSFYPHYRIAIMFLTVNNNGFPRDMENIGLMFSASVSPPRELYEQRHHPGR